MNNRAFLDNLIQAYNRRSREALLDLYHPQFEGEDVSEGKNATGREDVAKMIDYIFSAFPDLQMELLEYCSEGDRLAFFWMARGHQHGRLMNIPPTGKMLEFTGATMLTLRDDKIIKSRRLWDVAAMLRQIGLLPEISKKVYY